MEDKTTFPNEILIGSSELAESLRSMIELLACAHVSVLLTGESGAGKDLVARMIHAQGPRRKGPFVAVNCSALNLGVLESELFGHARGAFTGAVRPHAGFFEQAHSGTLFLDEIGEMPPYMQAKLLRVLQTQEVRRMGESLVRKVDVRLISATNADLGKKIKAGLFRRDLYYRINVIEVAIAPLRKRKEDIVELMMHFYRKRGKRPPRLTPEAKQSLMEYSWPGNIRELENEVERLIALFPISDVVAKRMLSERIQFPGCDSRVFKQRTVFEAPLAKIVEDLEQDILRRALALTNWNKSQAARKLGLSRQGLLKKIKRYGIKKDTFIVEEKSREFSQGRDARKDA